MLSAQPSPPRFDVPGSTASTAALEIAGGVVARPQLAAAVMGDAASKQGLARLREAVGQMRTASVQAMLEQAIAAIHADQPQTAAELSLKALQSDERNGLGWYLLAIAREKAGDFKSSIQCYETALQLIPDQVEIANNLGRLAFRMGMAEVAAKLFIHYLTRYPNAPDAANNLACALRELNRYDEAVEVLRPAIEANPAEAILWNTLGTVLAEQGEPEASLTFYDEALRVDPLQAKARYNRSNARLALGDTDGALEDCGAAIPAAKAEHEASMMRLARSTMLLAAGRLGEGWDGYEERLSPHYTDATHFMIERPRWTPDADLQGKRLLLMGEQGLGDEVLFGNVLPDVIEAVGPQGEVLLAVEPRLVDLFQRSFPEVRVGAHATYRVDTHTIRGAPFAKDIEAVDLWAPMASPLRRFRRRVEDFPARPSFLVPDPARVSHWRGVLDAVSGLPKVGLLWKSLKLDGARLRYFSPFDQWAQVLATPGVTFVNLQYGDCSAELAQAAGMLGIEIWQPEGIDLKDDLDDVAALSCALDLVMGPANATTNIAAACGAEVWLISTPGAWPRLGTDRYPWYPQARVFTPPAFNRWGPAMEAAAAALADNFAQTGTRALA
jgi:tetratricopeptide (TPR) repeat protein